MFKKIIDEEPQALPQTQVPPDSDGDGAGAHTNGLDPTDPTDTIAIAYARAARAMATVGWAEPAALLAVLAQPGEEHKALATAYGLTTRALSRATAKASARGILVGRAGAWVPVLPSLDGDGTASSATGTDVSKRLAERLALAEAGLLRFGGRKHGSSLERDVAVVLTAHRARFDVQVPYSSFLNTDRGWTADFVVHVGRVDVAVEVTGRVDALATIADKVAVAEAAGVPLLVLHHQGDLGGLPRRIVEAAKSAAEAKAPNEHEPDDPSRPKPYVTPGGVYIDPRAVRDRSRPPAPPPPPALQRHDPLPPAPPPPPIPGLDLPDHELRRLIDLEQEEEVQFLHVRLEAAREAARAELALLRESEPPDQRALRLLQAQRDRWRQERQAELASVPEAEPDQGLVVHGRHAFERETELTGKEVAEEDELPDDLEAGRRE